MTDWFKIYVEDKDAKEFHNVSQIQCSSDSICKLKVPLEVDIKGHIIKSFEIIKGIDYFTIDPSVIHEINLGGDIGGNHVVLDIDIKGNAKCILYDDDYKIHDIRGGTHLECLGSGTSETDNKLMPKLAPNIDTWEEQYEDY